MAIIAAIDIGSNAIRLAIGALDPHGDIKILKKIREPVRLGEDVFRDGVISAKNQTRALQTFKRFRNLIKINEVQKFRTVATSAVREAQNAAEFVKTVFDTTGIRIDVIDGDQEASLIHSAVTHQIDLRDRAALLIDIGGGSVELTLSLDGKIRGTESFKLGTVRLLQMLEDRRLKEKQLINLIQTHSQPIRDFIKNIVKHEHLDLCVGTGGNFECLGKLRVAMLDRTSIFSMTQEELRELVSHLETMTVKERTRFLRLRPDRADVIVPAALITQEIMAMAHVEMLAIPYVGLRDGILSEVAGTLEKKNSRFISRGWI